MSRFILYAVLIALVITAIILCIDYLLRPRASIVYNMITRKRYDEEKHAEKEIKEIWKGAKK